MKHGRVVAFPNGTADIGSIHKGFTDREANFHKNAIGYVVAASTREEYIQQFIDEGNEIMQITRSLYIDNLTCAFYRVSFD